MSLVVGFFELKKKSDGSFSRRKTHLVARGFNQIEGVVFAETFSPVVKFTTVRAILAIAVSSHWMLRQLDINNAFLYGDLEEIKENRRGILIEDFQIECVFYIDHFMG